MFRFKYMYVNTIHGNYVRYFCVPNQGRYTFSFEYVCVFICIYVYTYMYTYMYIYTLIHIFLYIHLYLCIQCIRIYIYICTIHQHYACLFCVPIRACSHISFIGVYTYIHVYIYICMYMYVCVCILTKCIFVYI